LTLQSGVLQVDGTLTSTGATFTGGTLQGTGYVDFLTNNGGDVIPGDAPAIGMLNVGSLTQTTGGTLTIPISSTGSFSVLSVQGGLADFGGTLALRPTSAYASSAAPGDAFHVVTDPMGPQDGTLLRRHLDSVPRQW
jgi:hypothetical protein